MWMMEDVDVGITFRARPEFLLSVLVVVRAPVRPTRARTDIGRHIRPRIVSNNGALT